jgi:hypothetical protein
MVGAVVVCGSTARGQVTGGINDVYDPWNSMYRQFIYPTAPPNGALPNQARLGYFQGRTPYNPYAPFDPNSPFDAGGRPAGRGVPYFDAFRRYDDEFNRNYVPNRGDSFYTDQAARERKYFEALRERDPVKRAEALKALEELNRSAARDMPGSRNRRTGSGFGGAGEAGATGGFSGGLDLRRQSGLLRRPPSALRESDPAKALAPEPALEPNDALKPDASRGVGSSASGLQPRPRTPLLGGGLAPSSVLDRARGMDGGSALRGLVPNPAVITPPSAPALGLTPRAGSPDPTSGGASPPTP